jgi:hypothetical protein
MGRKIIMLNSIIKYKLCILFLILCCNIFCQNNKEGENKFKPTKSQIENFEVVKKYLMYDYNGARLDSKNVYHDSLFALLSYIEDQSIINCAVDTFEIKSYHESKNGSFDTVFVMFPKVLEIMDVIGEINYYQKKISKIVIGKNGIMTRRSPHVNYRVMLNHYDKVLTPTYGWNDENIRENLKNKILLYFINK